MPQVQRSYIDLAADAWRERRFRHLPKLERRLAVAIEARRGCGFRKVGGLYLVSDGRAVVCDRLPILLEVCPTCGHGIKHARGWTWVDPAAIVGGVHPHCTDAFPCPLCMAPHELGERAGLLWIGERFYRTPREFDREAAALGVSRRISTVPRGFKIGETWILFAHPKALATPLHCGKCGALMRAKRGDERAGVELHCPWCSHKEPAFRPGIFKVWRPQRIEVILLDSQRGSELARDYEAAGITPVYVPDDDPDHHGTVYDDEEENGNATSAA
jgi:hypothetical protein